MSMTLNNVALLPPEDRYKQQSDENRKPEPIDFEIVDSRTFAETQYATEFLIDGIMTEGQPQLYGGPSKSLKTTVLVDQCLSLAAGVPFLGKYAEETPDRQLANPSWHIHSGNPPAGDVPVTFALMLNLVSASNAQDKATLWGFIKRYAPEADPASHPVLDHLTEYAINYYRDFVLPEKRYREPTGQERAALEALEAALGEAPAGASAEDLQTIVYETGKANGFADNLRDWFKAIYEVLLGQSQGPRFGSFIALYGVAETRQMIRDALARQAA